MSGRRQVSKEPQGRSPFTKGLAKIGKGMVRRRAGTQYQERRHVGSDQRYQFIDRQQVEIPRRSQACACLVRRNRLPPWRSPATRKPPSPYP